MPRKKTEELERKRIEVIKELVNEGYSANKIQKKLQEMGMGMKRQRLLEIVRELRGTKKREVRRVPKELEQKRIKVIREMTYEGYSANKIQKALQKMGLGMGRQRLLKLVRYFKEKLVQVAVYGTVKGKTRRVEIIGLSGSELYQAVKKAVKKAPKARFVKVRGKD
ncbi:MAG: hypothetical protein QXE92_03475, partial [Thermofilaceae archaeon]